jgi:hypothetical protein
LPPDAPAPAAPPPTGPVAPAPAATAPAPPKAAPPRPTVSGLSRKVVQTRPGRSSLPLPPAQPAAAPPPAVATTQPASGASPAGISATGVAPAAAPGADSAAAPKPAEPAPAAADKPPEPPPPKPETKVTEAEEARRLARISRAEKDLATKQQSFAQQQAQHAEDLKRVQLVSQAAELAKKNPLGFMQQAFGLTPQQILDSIIAEGARPAAAKAADDAARRQAEVDAKLADFEKTLQSSAEAEKARAHAESVAAYKTSAIAPVLADKAKYELTLRALGDKAVDEVFSYLETRYQITSAEVRSGKRRAPEVLTPAQAADRIEAHLRSQRDLLAGTSVAPGAAPQTTTRLEPPADPKSGSQTQNPAPPRGVFRPAKQPVVIRSKR